VRVLASTTAAGVYRDEAGRASCLVVGEGASELITPRALILATGAHDGGFLFENNDLPGVFAARAAALLAAAGVAVGQRVALAGRGPFSAALKRHLAGKAEIDEIDPATLLKAEGSSRVGAVVVLDGQQSRRVRCDALVIEAPPAPSFELAEQAGAAPVWAENRGFWPPGEAGAAVAPGVWVAGEARGALFDLQALVDEGERAAAAVG